MKHILLFVSQSGKVKKISFKSVSDAKNFCRKNFEVKLFTLSPDANCWNGENLKRDVKVSILIEN